LALWGRTYDNEDLARKAKTMQRRIDKLKEEQSFVSDGAPWRLSLRGKALAADQLLALDGLAVRAVPQSPVLFHVGQLWLKPGDRIALLGANGSGKSSLLRLCWQAIQAQEERSGLRYHHAANIGYYDQSLRQLSDDADLSDALYPFAVQNEAARSQVARRQALISAGFPYARHGQTVATLSGGERARLLFLGLSLASYHLLLLDEPSNHLDMQGKAELGLALQGFEGGCLLVSHDRDLIETACNRY
ncbi:MAG: ATP-binding cassette domain-containing protein, partial [Janthinobacterium sp.]